MSSCICLWCSFSSLQLAFLSVALIVHAQRNSNTTSLVQNGWWLIQWIRYNLLLAVSSQLGLIVNNAFFFSENTKNRFAVANKSNFNFTSLNIQFFMSSDIQLHGQKHTLRTLREILHHHRLKISWGKSLHKETTPLIMYTKENLPGERKLWEWNIMFKLWAYNNHLQH